MTEQPTFFGLPAKDRKDDKPLRAARPPAPPSLVAAPAPVAAPSANAPAVVDRTAQQQTPQAPTMTLDRLLAWIAEVDASDLHLASDRPPYARLHGELAPISGIPPISGDALSSMLTSIMNERQRLIFQEKRDVDFSYALSATARFRVNVFQQQGTISAVMRLIPGRIRTADDLHLPHSIRRLATLPRGLVLVTGPTGSGKSTLLAALIDLANRTRRAHIVTIEDPVEFTHRPHKSVISQREVGEDTESFSSALKHVLRQDPDIILVGEMRDLETTSIALSAAETGHLVFATLHTQSAPETISRIIDMFPAGQQQQVRSQLAGTLEAVITQTLVRQHNGNGRVAAREVLFFDHGVRNLVRENKIEQLVNPMQAGRDAGMHTLDHDLARLVNKGEVSYEEAVKHAHNLSELNKKTGRPDTGSVV